MFGFVKHIAGWWDGETIGTKLWSWRHGQEVGSDADGNTYYRNADGSRRWVFYEGSNDSSRVSAEWYGWLHFTYDDPPTVAPLLHKSWEKPHQPNLTGSEGAFLRKGSLRRGDVKPESDYEAWTPE